MTCPTSTMDFSKERRFYLLVTVLFAICQLTIFNLMTFRFNVVDHLISGEMIDSNTRGYGTAHYTAKKRGNPKHELLNFKDINRWNRTLNPSIYGPVEGHLPETMDKRTSILKRRMHPTKEDYHNIASGKYKPVDIMTLGPFKFHEQYRNPCWFEDEESDTSKGIKCLPYFYLIGAPKCGTTDLQKRLIQHPDISDRVVKESHWLTKYRFYPERGYVYPKFDHYLTVFSDGTRQIQENKDTSGYHPMIFGDCSPTTMVDNRYWTIHPPSKNTSESLYTNADYIHHLNPNAKIIAMLRNPVDRIYSEYMFFIHGSPEEFHDLVKKNILYTRECLKYNSLRYCFYKAPDNYTQAEIMLGWGVYFLHLKEFLRVFPRKQIFVIKLEDFSQNTVSYMRRIFSFLKIRQLPDDQLRQISSPEKRANERKQSDKEKGGMLVETRKILEDFYEPYNKLLVDLLGEQFDFNN